MVLPARDEAESVAAVVAEVHARLPGARVVVVDDGSRDRTAAVAREAGAEALRLPCRLGVGSAVRAGALRALGTGSRRMLRIDADGQHDPADGPRLLAALDAGADLCIGARATTRRHGVARFVATRVTAGFVSWLAGVGVRDPYSGFRAYSARAMRWIANAYPEDLPEPQEAVAMARAGLTVVEAEVEMRERSSGRTKFGGLGAVVRTVHALLAIAFGRAGSGRRA